MLSLGLASSSTMSTILATLLDPSSRLLDFLLAFSQPSSSANRVPQLAKFLRVPQLPSRRVALASWRHFPQSQEGHYATAMLARCLVNVSWLTRDLPPTATHYSPLTGSPLTPAPMCLRYILARLQPRLGHV
ncbi:hypothetical protein KM043_001245 [Ampulex compressa]|nr:hypothetical protein KM043_001245 [Ampulex compressa]